MGSVVKKRRKRMAKKKHRKLLLKTRGQRRRPGKRPESRRQGFSDPCRTRAGRAGSPPAPRRNQEAKMNVLVTGVSRYLGAHLAARLAQDPRVDRVVGVDTVAPAGELAAGLRHR